MAHPFTWLVFRNVARRCGSYSHDGHAPDYEITSGYVDHWLSTPARTRGTQAVGSPSAVPISQGQGDILRMDSTLRYRHAPVMTARSAARIMADKPHPEMGYRACLAALYARALDV